MNDRFKFRVWLIKENCYNHQEPFPTCCMQENGLLAYFREEKQMQNYIVEQCTGLKDKNGNLIYEGDIVKDSLLGRKYTVNWDCDNVQFEAIANVYDTEFSEVYGLYVDSAKELEIIGNVHEREGEK